jgi:hypothetical protein
MTESQDMQDGTSGQARERDASAGASAGDAGDAGAGVGDAGVGVGDAGAGVGDAGVQTYGSMGFIAAWTLLIILGMAVEFLARFFGYAENPADFFHPLIPAFTGIIAALIVLVGCLTLANEKAKQASMVRRKGVLLIMLGGFMLASFFASKQAIPLIFG